MYVHMYYVPTLCHGHRNCYVHWYHKMSHGEIGYTCCVEGACKYIEVLSILIDQNGAHISGPRYSTYFCLNGSLHNGVAPWKPFQTQQTHPCLPLYVRLFCLKLES